MIIFGDRYICIFLPCRAKEGEEMVKNESLHFSFFSLSSHYTGKFKAPWQALGSCSDNLEEKCKQTAIQFMIISKLQHFKPSVLTFLYVHMVEPSKHHKIEFILYSLMIHITFNSKIVVTAKLHSIIY
jgi:hypothetical protein